MYRDMVAAVVAFEQGNKFDCLMHMQQINVQLRGLVKVFYQNLVEARVAKGVWLGYCQSFQAWGAGRMIDGEYVEFDGVSGSHNLCFMVVDAFIGMKSYMNEQNLRRYVPRNQRSLIAAFRKHSFFMKLHKSNDKDISDEFGKIVQHLKVLCMTIASHNLLTSPFRCSDRLTEPA
jgi:hypothetical protein